MKIFKISTFSFVTAFLFTENAHAYIDPASISSFFSLIVAGIISGFFFSQIPN